MKDNVRYVDDNPIAQQAITKMRTRGLPTAEFRFALRQLATILCFEASRDLKTISTSVRTPLETTQGSLLAGDILLVPVLRAGLGMLPAFQTQYPSAAIGLIWLKRDEEDFAAAEKGVSLPDDLSGDTTVFLLDPMIATGGSAISAINLLKQRRAKQIILVSAIIAPEGIEKIQLEHPDVHIVAGVLDRKLNEKKYILPGLGDAGDRFVGF